ncbi:hypothetical protein LJR225_000051 [Phenylobacterium sp. LjRoot225]|uniref:hypothetical protein n=1 Tax=Phenylobacterium sp. LjRoot225 TaxID=3342285 RepID=UPI003ED0F75D
MRLAIFVVLASLAPAPAAFADPVYETRSAVGACLAAVIDKAPVVDGKGQDVSLHREASPNLCAVTVTGGDPAEVRRSALDAIAARPEGFGPAKTAWAADGGLASRETLCNAPGRRALNVVLDTAKPGASPVLVATVVEARARDQRCDIDMGLQP